MALSEEQVARIIEIAMDLARQGQTDELLEFIDRGLAVDVQDGEGNTLLMLAAYHGHAETVQGLIDRGADVDLPNARNQAPIAGAIFKGEDEIVALLRAAGADLHAGTPSAQETAALFGRTDLLE